MDAWPPDAGRKDLTGTPAALQSSLRWAEEAAAGGDPADALAWLQVAEAAGYQLPASYESKRRAWTQASRHGVSADR